MLVIAGLLLVVFSVISAYLIYSGIRNRSTARASETWPVAGGTVLSSDVASRVSRQKNSSTVTYYKPQIRYGYKVAGTEYESEVIRFGDLEKQSRSLADEIVAKYPVGSTIAVRYDPQDPKRATLETQSAGGSQVGAGIFFIAVPLAIAIGTALILFLSDEQKSSLPPEVLEQLNRPNQRGVLS
jgi:Protein of unknown function (DUF3592)